MKDLLQAEQKVVDDENGMTSGLGDDVDSDDELDKESGLYEVAHVRISRQTDRHVYDNAVESLKSGEPCTVQLQSLGLHKRYSNEDNSEFIAVAAGAFGLHAPDDEVLMQTLYAIVGEPMRNAEEKDNMLRGLSAATEADLQLIADSVGVVVSICNTAMESGNQFELKPDTPGFTEAMRRACTTYKPRTIGDSSGARHIILQTVRKALTESSNDDDDEYSNDYIEVDLVSLVTDTTAGGDSMTTDDIAADAVAHSNDDDGTAATFRSALLALLSKLQRDSLAELAAVAKTDQTFLIAETQAKLAMLNKLVHDSKEKIELSQE
eukprot:17846-Heterococcus_DN1.PRE.1